MQKHAFLGIVTSLVLLGSPLSAAQRNSRSSFATPNAQTAA